MKKKRNKPIAERETIIVNNIPRRLNWVAKNKPDILLKKICQAGSRNHAYFSALANAGYPRGKLYSLIENHPEWGIDMGVFAQM